MRKLAYLFVLLFGVATIGCDEPGDEGIVEDDISNDAFYAEEEADLLDAPAYEETDDTEITIEDADPEAYEPPGAVPETTFDLTPEPTDSPSSQEPSQSGQSTGGEGQNAVDSSQSNPPPQPEGEGETANTDVVEEEPASDIPEDAKSDQSN